MKYVSTRGGESCSSAYAIKKGLASDGGLFLPDEIPHIDKEYITKLCSLSYAERAAEVMSLFLADDYSYDELLDDCRSAYSAEKFKGGAAPIHELKDGIAVLELWHGPTAAFKDMALQIMPRLLSRSLSKTGEKRCSIILVATSGDTGKAALEGYRDIDGIKILVFYPVHGVSTVQKLQMATQKGNNVSVASIVGNFDDAQNGVKQIFADEDFAKMLDEKGYFLSSANSINWGRLVPQIVYYISAYCDLVTSGSIKLGEEINICVPTGNFGNIFAAYLAKEMGLFVNKFICASNSNNVLTDFINTGVYDRNRKFYATISPSMDILISSNLERLLRILSNEEDVREYMSSLAKNGRYEVKSQLGEKIRKEFYAGFCTEEETMATIKAVFDSDNYLIDTHTAVGLKCAKEYVKQSNDNHKMLVASTASPYKFAKDVLFSLNNEVCETELESIDRLSEVSGTDIAYPLVDIAKREVRFNPENAIEKDKMREEIVAKML